jgi:hypothetical protein
METSFANPTRVQAGLDEDEKKQIQPPKYEHSNFDPSFINLSST